MEYIDYSFRIYYDSYIGNLCNYEVSCGEFNLLNQINIRDVDDPQFLPHEIESLDMAIDKELSHKTNLEKSISIVKSASNIKELILDVTEIRDEGILNAVGPAVKWLRFRSCPEALFKNFVNNHPQIEAIEISDVNFMLNAHILESIRLRHLFLRVTSNKCDWSKLSQLKHLESLNMFCDQDDPIELKIGSKLFPENLKKISFTHLSIDSQECDFRELTHLSIHGDQKKCTFLKNSMLLASYVKSSKLVYLDMQEMIIDNGSELVKGIMASNIKHLVWSEKNNRIHETFCELIPPQQTIIRLDFLDIGRHTDIFTALEKNATIIHFHTNYDTFCDPTEEIYSMIKNNRSMRWIDLSFSGIDHMPISESDIPNLQRLQFLNNTMIYFEDGINPSLVLPNLHYGNTNYLGLARLPSLQCFTLSLNDNEINTFIGLTTNIKYLAVFPSSGSNTSDTAFHSWTKFISQNKTVKCLALVLAKDDRYNQKISHSLLQNTSIESLLLNLENVKRRDVDMSVVTKYVQEMPSLKRLYINVERKKPDIMWIKPLLQSSNLNRIDIYDASAYFEEKYKIFSQQRFLLAKENVAIKIVMHRRYFTYNTNYIMYADIDAWYHQKTLMNISAKNCVKHQVKINPETVPEEVLNAIHKA